MKTEEQLDSILGYLDKMDNRLLYVSIDHIYKDSKTTLDFKIVDMIVEKLYNDGYVGMKLESASLGVPPEFPVYRISFHGRLFLSRGGYRSESRQRTYRTAWTIFKTIANAANAAIIIIIAFWTLSESKKSREQEDRNNEQMEIIEKRVIPLENSGAQLDSLTLRIERLERKDSAFSKP